MAKLSQLMAKANEPNRTPMVAQPVSNVQIAALLAQVSTPRLTAEFTPHGTVTRQVRTDHDRHILHRVETMREKLATRRNLAKQAFKRAHGI